MLAGLGGWSWARSECAGAAIRPTTIKTHGAVLGPMMAAFLTNQASHHIDMLEWFFGDVVSVHARATTALVKIEAEDTAVATLKFRNGALGIIEATTAIRPKDLEGSLSILERRARSRLRDLPSIRSGIGGLSENFRSDKEVIEKFSVNPPNVYGFGHQAYYEHVVDCLLIKALRWLTGLRAARAWN